MAFFDDALAGRHAGQLAGQARALDRERRVGGQQVLPRDVVAAVEQLVKRRGLVGSQQQQDAFRRAQVQVGGGDNVRPALERHAAIGDLDVLCAQTLDLKFSVDSVPKSRRDHSIECRHRCPFLLMCRLFCRGEHCSPAGGQ